MQRTTWPPQLLQAHVPAHLTNVGSQLGKQGRVGALAGFLESLAEDQYPKQEKQRATNISKGFVDQELGRGKERDSERRQEKRDFGENDQSHLLHILLSRGPGEQSVGH